MVRKVVPCFAQLRVLAVDGGQPAKSSSATVEINVSRNLNAPRFTTANPLPVSIPEIMAAGTSITKVQAVDDDSAVSSSPRINSWNHCTVTESWRVYQQGLSVCVKWKYQLTAMMEIISLTQGQNTLVDHHSCTAGVSINTFTFLPVLLQFWNYFWL